MPDAIFFTPAAHRFRPEKPYRTFSRTFFVTRRTVPTGWWCAWAWRSRYSAADKMHDLQLVPILQSSLRPLVARHDLPVQLDGHAVRLHAKLLDQRTQCVRGTLATLAVDGQVHSASCQLSALSKTVDAH